MATPTVDHSGSPASAADRGLDVRPVWRPWHSAWSTRARRRQRDAGRCLDALRDARARATGDQELIGWLDAAIAFAHWGLERAPSRAAVAQGTQAHDFLRVLDGSPQLGSAELRRVLEIDETQVSRTGRRLLESGLVTGARSAATCSGS